MKLQGVEIFAVGVWNGMEFTQDDLQNIADNWAKLSAVHKVPLKLGHNEDQPMTDGFPALGFATNVRVEDDKLVADFDHVPDIVNNAIKNRLYNSVSIELDIGVEYKGDKFKNVLSGVALLGADLPAVNTLEDLSAFVPESFSRFKRMTFSAITQEINNMPDDKVNAEIEALKAQLKEQAETKARFERENAELRAKQAETEEAHKKAAFSAAKAKVVSDLEDLVKSEVITPAQREDFTSKITETSIEHVADVVSVLGNSKHFSKSTEQAETTEPTESAYPDDDLFQKISEVQVNKNVNFSTAKAMVFKANPVLARSYITMFDGGA